MRKTLTIFAAATAIASGAAVLQLKITVQNKVDNVKEIARQIKQDREAIRVLEAEWAYLTTPQVLQDRSIRFLALMPPRAKQIIADPSLIPFRPKGLEVEAGEGVLLPAAQKELKSSKEKKSKQTEGQTL
ncbi:cell division protein FtsL [Kordiimonas laminariae]|uniref:cell division protein FtsL n=1 Tax=Kordiimonas laminariae TaxID=2917717 RepID=UPI001FF60192|nr:hypothetical protein [Kordiimonas laminariae]MCK0068668.1 hypothetical protein [Kordiimonas laminariae]